MPTSLWFSIALLVTQLEPGAPIIPGDTAKPGEFKSVSFQLTNTPTVTNPATSTTTTTSTSVTEPGGVKTSEEIANSTEQTMAPVKSNDALTAFLAAENTEARLAAAAILAAKKDERILPLLSYISIHDNKRATRRKAINLIAKFSSTAGNKALARTVIFTDKNNAKHALKILLRDDRPATQSALEIVVRHKTTRPQFRDKVKLRLAVMTGVDVKEVKAGKNLRDYFYPALAGSVLGATALQRIGALGKSDDGSELGFVGGTLIGVGTGILLSEEFSVGDSMYYLSSGIWGLAMGNFLERAIFEPETSRLDEFGNELDPEGDNLRRSSFELLGELALVGGAYLMNDTLKPTWQDVFTINATSITSMGIALGALGFAEEQEDTRPLYASLLAAQAVGLGVGTYFAKDLEFKSGDLALIPYGFIEGAWYGNFITDTYIDSDKAGAGLLLGGSLGIVGASILSQNVDLTPQEVIYLGASGGYGKLLGVSLGLLANGSSDALTGAMLGGGLLGITSAAVTMNKVSFKLPQMILTPAATLIGFAHGGSISALVGLGDSLSGDQLAGLTLTTGVGFGIAASVLGQKYDLKTWDVTMSGLGWLWGAWFSGWTMGLSDFVHPTAPMIAVLTADAALALTTYLVAPQGGNIDSRVVGWASLGGIGTSAIAVLFTALASNNWQALATSNLVGSAAGLALGGYLSHQYLYKDAKDIPSAPGNPKNTSSISTPFELLGIIAAPQLNEEGQMDGMLINASFGL